MDKWLLEILICPVSRAPLMCSPDGSELWCSVSSLAYPIRDGVPVLLPDQARSLAATEQQEIADLGADSLHDSTPAPGTQRRA